MNRTTLTLALTLGMLLLLVACASPEVDKRLADIEQQMHSQPDSALAHIQELSLQHRITHPRQRAWHALLHAQALDKNFIDSTNDSIINIAVEYYENSNDLYHKMLSFYYLGRIKYNAKEYEPCIIALLNAEMCALEIEDFFYQGLIYRSFAHVYNTIYYGNGEMEYAQKSYEAFSKTNFQQHTDFALLELAQTYYNNKKFDVCELIINELVNSVSISDDAHFHYLTYILKADLFLATGLYNEALIIYEDLINIDSDKFTAIDYIHLSMCHQQCNDIVNAQKYAQKAATLDSMETWGLYKIYKTTGNYEAALRYLENEISLQNNALREIIDQGIFQEVTKFHQKVQHEKLIIERYKRNLSVCILLFFVVAIIIMSGYYLMKKEKEVQRNFNRANELSEILTFKESEHNKEVQQMLREIFSARFDIINHLCRNMFENSGSKKIKRKISEEMENLIKDMTSESEILKKIIINIDANHSSVVSSLKKDLPNLRNEDYLLFIYTILGFSISAIAYLLKEDKIDAVYNRKARLKTKINKLETERKNLYLQYM